MMDIPWRLWGTFSVADHTRVHPFVADVLVYDRLVIPTPATGDESRWADKGWRPDAQAELIDILREGDRSRVLAVPWSSGTVEKRGMQDAFEAKKADLAAEVGFDIGTITQIPQDEPVYYVTRAVLMDRVSPERDERFVSTVRSALPPVPGSVSVVAAYGREEDFCHDVGARSTDSADPVSPDSLVAPDQLLGGFVWPFLVPDRPGWSDQDLLRKAVEFANRDETIAYRRAFHQWRRGVVDGLLTPKEAVDQLRHEIDDYRSALRREKGATVVSGACAVVGVTAAVAASLLPAVGLPVLAAYVGAGGALVPGAGQIGARLFRGKTKARLDQPVGALFWEARRAFSG